MFRGIIARLSASSSCRQPCPLITNGSEDHQICSLLITMWKPTSSQTTKHDSRRAPQTKTSHSSSIAVFKNQVLYALSILWMPLSARRAARSVCRPPVCTVFQNSSPYLQTSVMKLHYPAVMTFSQDHKNTLERPRLSVLEGRWLNTYLA